jgi:hypothetical protein
MAIDRKNSYVVGSNNDLTNALLNIDLNRIGGDLTYLENDGGTLKVSVGSLIESQGSIYAVSGAAETPSGTAQEGAYLFFDDSVPEFVWSTTAGTYDPTRGGFYDGSNRRQCRWIALRDSTFEQIQFIASIPYFYGRGLAATITSTVLSVLDVRTTSAPLSNTEIALLIGASSPFQVQAFALADDSISAVGSASSAITLANAIVEMGDRRIASYLSGASGEVKIVDFDGSTFSVFATKAISNLQDICPLMSTLIATSRSSGSDSIVEIWDISGGSFVLQDNLTITDLLTSHMVALNKSQFALGETNAGKLITYEGGLLSVTGTRSETASGHRMVQLGPIDCLSSARVIHRAMNSRMVNVRTIEPGAVFTRDGRFGVIIDSVNDELTLVNGIPLIADMVSYELL